MTLENQRKRLGRERILIALFLMRQCASVVLLVALLTLSWQLPDRRMTYVLAPFVLAFIVFVLVLTVRFLRTYRQRKRRVDAREVAR